MEMNYSVDMLRNTRLVEAADKKHFEFSRKIQWMDGVAAEVVMRKDGVIMCDEVNWCVSWR